MVKFVQLETDAGLAKLNKHLEQFSYVEGYTPSTEDVEAFHGVAAEPDNKKHPHAARWYRHIRSYSQEERSTFPTPSASATTTTAGEEKPAKEEEKPAEKKEVVEEKKEEPKKEAADEDDVDLFGDDDENDEWAVEMEKRAQEALKKQAESGKLKPIAKSKVVLDVKPVDDETDMNELEKWTRSIEQEGLTWQASSFVPVAYGIKKLQIQAVVIDELVSLDDIQERIQENEDLVQSTDVVSFQKL
jgi:elongation factor 1-beta